MVTPLLLSFSRLSMLLLLCILAWNTCGATTISMNVASNSASPWTPPPGVTTIEVAVQGAGGGGGQGNNNSATGGGGGGGACAYNASFPVSSATNYSFQVGGGGPGSGGSNGKAGGASTFATLTANGGGGGKDSPAVNRTGAGGAGGTAVDSVVEGTVLYSGGAGGGTGGNAEGYGAGGGGAGTGGPGTNAISAGTTNKGKGGGGGIGNPAGANGANCPALGNAGIAGSDPGAGGSGGYRNMLTKNGAAGGDGQIVITYTIPTFNVTYDANGSTNAPSDPTVYNFGSTVNLLGPGAMVNAGYVFAGWNTAADGTGTSYAAYGVLSNIQSIVTLYAQWATPPPEVLTIESAPDGTGILVGAQNIPSGNTVTGYAVVRTGSGTFVANPAVDWALTGLTGGVIPTDLAAAGDNKSAVFTGAVIGSCRMQASSSQSGASQSDTLTVVVGTATQFGIESAADGSGGPVVDQNLGPGGKVPAYAIQRDFGGNFVANVAATWSLVNLTGGVAIGDLSVAADNKSATFTGNQLGSVNLQAASGTFPVANSGALSVLAPWTLVGDAGANAGDKKYWVTNQSAATLPPNCNMMYCPGGILPANNGNKHLRDFWIGETEVTFDLWSEVKSWALTNGYFFQNPGHHINTVNNPVDTVSWRDAVVWCNALSERAGLTPVYVDYLAGQVIRDSRDANADICDRAVNNAVNGANGFRLPSQWEWECAARWKGDGNWSSGDGPSGTHGQANAFAIYSNFGNSAMPAISRQPNYLGCYHMSGNLGEWCFGTSSAGAYIRNLRGGSYYQGPPYQGVDIRLGFFPDAAGLGTGLRLALSKGSLGTSYVVNGGPVSAPVRAPGRVFTSGRVCLNFHYQNQKMDPLENPDAFPINRANLGGIKLDPIYENVYGDYDPALVPHIRRINQTLFNMFQQNTLVFGPNPVSPSDNQRMNYGAVGYTPAFVNGIIKQIAADESAGREQYGAWFFREDVEINPHLLPNGDIDTAYYGAYSPPFYGINHRILSQQDINNIRTALANSNLKCKSTFKVIQLLGEDTMRFLLHPELYNDNPASAQAAAACLAYLKANFDGVAMENHINALNPVTLTAIGLEAKWCQDNGLTAFIFMGGGVTSDNFGLGYAKGGYEAIFKQMQNYGVMPNSPNIIWFRQAAFQAQSVLPENIVNDDSTGTFSLTAWLDKRLSGPLISNRPNLAASNNVLWSWQPVVKSFDATKLSWSIANAPAGMTVDPDTGLVQWTPGDNDDSSGVVTLTVTNTIGDGGSDSYDFEVLLPSIFNLAQAKPLPTAAGAAITLLNQNISGVPCTVKLGMTGYSLGYNVARLDSGAGSTAGGLIVAARSGNSIDADEGINFDIQVTGAVTNLSYQITQFTIRGNTDSQRNWNITDQPGSQRGHAGNVIDGSINGRLGSGIPVPVTMDPEPLQNGFDFAWNRTTSGGAIMGLATITIQITGTPIVSNTAPVLTAIPNQTLIAGQTLTVSNTATDSDVPAQTLNFSLLNAPAGATIDQSLGVFTWRPTIAQSPSTNVISVKVEDNGVPSLSATQSFLVTVIKPAKPSLSNVGISNQQFTFIINGDSGPDYAIEASTDLENWSSIWTNPSPTPPFQFTDPDIMNFPRRFYRVRIAP